MRKLTCTLEFKEGRPVAKTVNQLGEEPTIINNNKPYCLEDWQSAENSRREFEIDQGVIFFSFLDECYKIALDGTHNKPIKKGDRFTATIENNIVTKIELL